jgi:amino acid transporter
MIMANQTVFVREATGLVRSLGVWDTVFFNFIAFGGAWSILYALTYAPYYGGDPAVSLLMTLPGILALLGMYYIFNTAMPRSGGDYVFNSRILHPAIGFAANFVGYAFFVAFFLGDGASLFSSSALAQTLSVYGVLTSSSWPQSAATWMIQPWNNFLLGTVVVAGAAVILMIGNKLYFRLQNYLSVISVVGLVIIAALLLATLLNPSSFVSAFNHYAINVNPTNALMTPNPYENITASVASSAPDISPTNMGANLLLVPLWFTVLFWVFGSNYLAGEIKNVQKTAKIGLFGGLGLVFILTLVIIEAAYYALGFNFVLGTDNIFYGYVANTLGAPPNLMMFSAIIAGNPLLVLFLGIGMVAAFVIAPAFNGILLSRILFGYSFDRLFPQWIAHVNYKFNTPTYAVAIAAVGGEIWLALISGIFGGTTSATALTLYSYAGLAAVGITFVVTSISAIVFPYRKKQLYETACTVKRKVLGVPIIVWLGVITLVYSFMTFFWYAYDQEFYFFGCPAGGVVACDFNPFLGLLALFFIGSIGYYYLAKWYRSREGIDLDLVFKEIPPE